MDYPGKVITKTQVTPTQTSASGNWTVDDAVAAVKNNNWPVALVPNPISKSLRFNSADSAYLNRTLTTPTDGKRWTWSGWVKRGILTNGTGTAQQLFSAGSATAFFRFSSTDTLLSGWTGAANLETTQVFRDASAWYHIMLVVDTTQATASNRVKYYVNGSQITAFSSTDYPTQNSTTTINSAVAHNIGAYQSSSQYFNGYMTEINFIDGQALTPSSFGMTNPQTGQWIPLKYSGTYGTNGFYLNFKDATSTTTLGLDYSGNANNWTTNNFSVTAGAGNDSLTDVPTPWFAYNTTGDVGGVIRGNYCTLNPLAKNSTPTLSNGNLDMSGYNAYGTIYSTFGVSSGKWYWEEICGGNDNMIGIASTYNLDNYPGQTGTSVAYNTVGGGLNASNVTVSGTTSSYASGDIISVALDMDNGKCWWAKNGTWQNSGVPASGTNASATGLSGTFFPVFRSPSSGTSSCNFGQRPFAYTPPTGFRSLCTTNLPATAIGFGLTNQGDNYFGVTTWTGNGGTLTVSGLEFTPEAIWIKRRDTSNNHRIVDVVRGYDKEIYPNLTNAEGTFDWYSSITSTGYVIDVSDASYNANAGTYVGWNWKAGGTGVSNTAGTITSTVSANTTAGFSVVTYTGNGTNPGATIGHGLGVAPSMIITKSRSGTGEWPSYHVSIGVTNTLYLNATYASSTYLNRFSAVSSTTFTTGSNGSELNSNGVTYVAYCFAAVPGYSAFGSYTGNGSADGPFVYTGFRPKFVLLKVASGATGDWQLQDTARDLYNCPGNSLFPNGNYAENFGYLLDILSNGFKLRNSSSYMNGSGNTIIYAAFAESPFQFSNAR